MPLKVAHYLLGELPLWALGRVVANLMLLYALLWHLSMGSLGMCWHFSTCSLKNYCHQSTCSFESWWHMSSSLQYDLANDLKPTKTQWNAILSNKNLCDVHPCLIDHIYPGSGIASHLKLGGFRCWTSGDHLCHRDGLGAEEAEGVRQRLRNLLLVVVFPGELGFLWLDLNMGLLTCWWCFLVFVFRFLFLFCVF